MLRSGDEVTEADKPTPQELINEVRHTLYISRKMGRKTIRIEDIETIVGKAEAIWKILGIKPGHNLGVDGEPTVKKTTQ